MAIAPWGRRAQRYLYRETRHWASAWAGEEGGQAEGRQRAGRGRPAGPGIGRSANSSDFLRPACDSPKFCAIVSLLRSSSSFEQRGQASATDLNAMASRSAAGPQGGEPAMTLSNQRSANFAKGGANQAEASCIACKNCAIVLGLAGDDKSGFTRWGGLNNVASRLGGNQPLERSGAAAK